MKTINLSNLITAMTDKCDEMMAGLEAVLNSPKNTDATKRTQKFQRNKAIHDMCVCQMFVRRLANELSEGTIEVEDEMAKWIDSMVTLTSERKAKYTVEVHEGDRISELLQKYSEMSDVYKKLMKAADEAGLKANFTNDMFVKA